MDYIDIRGFLKVKEINEILKDLGKEGWWRDSQLPAGAHNVDTRLHKTVPFYNGMVEHNSVLSLKVLNNREVMNFSLPKKMSAFNFDKYALGFQYDWHVDQWKGDKMVNDVAVNIVLSGSLSVAIQHVGGGTGICLHPGDLLLHDCGAVHTVSNLTGGETIAAVAWIESWVKPLERPTVREAYLEVQDAEGTPMYEYKYRIYQNLMRDAVTR